MTTKVQRWGNSLAVRIPAPFAKDIGLSQGVDVNLSIEEGRLIIDPSASPRYTLSSLLKKVPKKSLHSETDWGSIAGNEVW